ncbi:ABC transporter substrate-binding protein [Sinorhizobium meliloti]|uniref:ABC transporter substrate-binding protein n=1 Tax=Rhizobium meliloti TaxID=382 RepID=A0A2J0YTX9_RHIML|nr:ABC transporter substrate-binding protein [Sinorhizobium meliloti]PJR09848.1 ABC transporter substrate-binding protein [Sinorhizobium meliloti]
MNWKFLPLLAATLLFPAGVMAKSLVFCSEASPDSFSPMLTTTGTTEDATRPVYNRLLQFQPGTTNLAPSLAESWEVSKDGKEVTLHLRTGVKWHSNENFTPTRDFSAADVVFTFERQMKPDHPYHKVSGGNYSVFNGFGFAELIREVVAVDDYTVKFLLSRPSAPFLSNLATDFASIMSAEYADVMLAAGQPEVIDQEPIGTGPFTFVDYRRNSTIRYRAFDGYWGQKPAIDTLVFSINTDAAVRFSKLQANECQVIAYPNVADLPLIKANSDLKLLQKPGVNVGYLALNVDSKLLKDKRVRQALNMSIDKQRIVDNVYKGVGVAAKNLLPPTLWGYNDDVKDYPYDPSKAKALLADAGFADGFEIDLWVLPVQRPYNPDGRRMAEMMQSDLTQIGVRAKLVSYEWADYLQRLRQGEHSMAQLGWTNINGDPDDFFMSLASCDAAASGSNRSKWCNEEFDSLIKEASRLSDRGEREKLYRKAQEIMHEDAPFILIAHAQISVATRANVTGYDIDLFSHHEFAHVDLSE